MASSDLVWARGCRPPGSNICRACDGEGLVLVGEHFKECRICGSTGWVIPREKNVGAPPDKTIEQYAEEKAAEKAKKVDAGTPVSDPKVPASPSPAPVVEGTGQEKPEAPVPQSTNTGKP